MHATMRKIALLTENSREYGRELLKGVAEFAQERRNWMLRLLTPSDLRSRSPLAGFDGVIARLADQATRKKLAACRLPVVDTFCQNPSPAFIGVDSDHEAIGVMAAEHFLSRGFKNFAFCGFNGTAFSDSRRKAFVKTIGNSALSCNIYSAVELPDDAMNFAERADLPAHARRLRAWFTSLPPQTAVFCANDVRAYQLLRIAAEANIPVPQNASILGVDNDTLLCSFASPPLSSIDPNARRVGYAAARLLHTAMENPSANKIRPVYRVRPGDLVERASTEFHPVEPAWLSEALVFIDRNMARPVSTADIVDISGLSHTSVEKTFRRVFGESAGKYIVRTKMNEAQRLIDKGGLSGKEIAARTGFSSPQYFCRTYRAFFGHPPFS